MNTTKLNDLTLTTRNYNGLLPLTAKLKNALIYQVSGQFTCAGEESWLHPQDSEKLARWRSYNYNALIYGVVGTVFTMSILNYFTTPQENIAQFGLAALVILISSNFIVAMQFRSEREHAENAANAYKSLERHLYAIKNMEVASPSEVSKFKEDFALADEEEYHQTAFAIMRMMNLVFSVYVPHELKPEEFSIAFNHRCVEQVMRKFLDPKNREFEAYIKTFSQERLDEVSYSVRVRIMAILNSINAIRQEGCEFAQSYLNDTNVVGFLNYLAIDEERLNEFIQECASPNKVDFKIKDPVLDKLTAEFSKWSNVLKLDDQVRIQALNL